MLLLAAPAFAQEEVPMTPTPTATPAVAPIPTYPEKGGGSTATNAAGDTAKTSNAVRIDAAGMFGAGFMIGNTSTGANAKIWFGDDVAAQFSIGAGPLGNNLRFHFDLLYVFYQWDAGDNLYSLPFYVGAGGAAGVYWKHPWPDDRTDLGVRVPIGMSVVIPDNPVEIYFEVAPNLSSYHDDFDDENHFVFFVDGAIGVRYYF